MAPINVCVMIEFARLLAAEIGGFVPLSTRSRLAANFANSQTRDREFESVSLQRRVVQNFISPHGD
jgi:hypothetical protein